MTRLPVFPAATIPASPRIPAAPTFGAIPPSPAIPGVVPAMPWQGPRTTPAMGVPRQGIPSPVSPAAQQMSQPSGRQHTPIPRVIPAAPPPPQAGAGRQHTPLPRVIPGPPPAPPMSPAPESARGFVGRVIGDRYGINAIIGQGGMGVVYEAEHLTIGKVVAVKILHPSKAQNKEAISRLRHEARVAGTLGHPNICAVYDLGRMDDGSPYLVMERLRGETLDQRIKRVGRLATTDMVDILLQVLSALAAAHQRGVIHRDLKPENIFLSQREGMRPVPKLLDFGISKAEDIEETQADPTGARLEAGTPFYMAPEQARGDRGLDWRVDLWAAGVVLYEGLTGVRPFQAKNYNALLVQILSMPHRPLREVDPTASSGLSRVVDRALAKRPEDRYQSALEFQNALRSHKELDDDAPRKAAPIFFSEATSDDSDATTVFHRIQMEAPPPVGEEDATPVYAAPEDDERTVVEPPPFLNETIVMVQDPAAPAPRRVPRPGPDPRRKR